MPRIVPVHRALFLYMVRIWHDVLLLLSWSDHIPRICFCVAINYHGTTTIGLDRFSFLINHPGNQLIKILVFILTDFLGQSKERRISPMHQRQRTQQDDVLNHSIERLYLKMCK